MPISRYSFILRCEYLFSRLNGFLFVRSGEPIIHVKGYNPNKGWILKIPQLYPSYYRRLMLDLSVITTNIYRISTLFTSRY